jgi:hypothetical protein
MAATVNAATVKFALRTLCANTFSTRTRTWTTGDNNGKERFISLTYCSYKSETKHQLPSHEKAFWITLLSDGKH